jgi:hypothetical protein
MLAAVGGELVVVTSSLAQAGVFPAKAPFGDMIEWSWVGPSVGTGWSACTLLSSEKVDTSLSVEFVGKKPTRNVSETDPRVGLGTGCCC